MTDETHGHGKGFLARNLSRKECGDTGMAMVLVCLLAGWFSGQRDWILAAIVLLVANMVWPTLYMPVAKVWLTLSNLLGAVMSRVILTVIFYIVVTPLALVRRLLGGDPMRIRAWKKGRESVFETRDHTFTPKEIERPF